MVAQKNIAEKLGISRTAVSAILSGGANAEKFRPEMRRRVLKAAEELGYQHNELARAIRTGRNNVLGFVTQSIRNEYAGRVLDGVIQSTTENDFSVRIISINQERNAPKLAKQCAGQCLAGVILYDVSDESFLSSLYDLLDAHGIPLVVAGGSVKMEKGLWITSDTVQGGNIVFEHLYQLGHRDFLLSFAYSWTAYSQGLYQGFSNAAAEAGIRLPKCSKCFFHDNADSEKIARIIAKNRVTACFCNTDFHALQLIMTLQKHGIRVPEDVSVMGRGNLRFCRALNPPLSTIDESLDMLGKRAAELIFERIGHRNRIFHRESIPHKLVIRASTAEVGGNIGKIDVESRKGRRNDK